jgi:tRNA threonylcarbamoyl adenosine modification protein YeaZ
MQLAISTATAACSVALLDGNEICGEQHIVVGRGHAERLIPMIAALPGNGRADHIFVDCGPGSFTGVRVGLAAARALALAWKIPLSGFSTMALIAAGFDGDSETLGVAIQGGHGEFFVQDFKRTPLSPCSALASLPPGAASLFTNGDVILGSAADRLISERGSGRAFDALPRAADVRLLPAALRSLPANPIYGRRPDAIPA